MTIKSFVSLVILISAFAIQSCSAPALLPSGRVRMCQNSHISLRVEPLTFKHLSDSDDPYGDGAHQRADSTTSTDANSEMAYTLAQRINASGMFDNVVLADGSIVNSQKTYESAGAALADVLKKTDLFDSAARKNTYELRGSILSYGEKRSPSLGTFLPFIVYVPVGVIGASALGVSPALGLIPGFIALIATLVEGYQYNHTYSIRSYFELKSPAGARVWSDTVSFVYSDIYTESFSQTSFSGRDRVVSTYSYDASSIASEQLEMCWQRVADSCITKIDKVLNSQ